MSQGFKILFFLFIYFRHPVYDRPVMYTLESRIKITKLKKRPPNVMCAKGIFVMNLRWLVARLAKKCHQLASDRSAKGGQGHIYINQWTRATWRGDCY